MNHDTQPSRALEAPISDWFIPHACALIPLREPGYPCLFYGVISGLKDGVEGGWRGPSVQGRIADLTLAMKFYAYREQKDYFDAASGIGWVRRGTWDRPDGVAMVLSTAGPDQKRIFVAELHRGEEWMDLMGWAGTEVEIGEDGFGMFPVGQTSISVFVDKVAMGQDAFGEFGSNISR